MFSLTLLDYNEAHRVAIITLKTVLCSSMSKILTVIRFARVHLRRWLICHEPENVKIRFRKL